MPKPSPTIERLRYLFSIREDGELIWNVSTSWRVNAGDVAGCYSKRDGYVVVCADYKLMRVHRVVFAITHGRWADSDVDHINGNRRDNRPENLREATRSQNNANRHKSSTVSKITGVYGVGYDKSRDKYTVQVKNGNKKVSKRFNTVAEAVEFRKSAIIEVHGEFANK